MKLPTEIFDLIIQHAGEDDERHVAWTSLWTCCRVSHFLRELAMKHLYMTRFLFVRSDMTIARMTLFQKVMVPKVKMWKGISQYVQKVEVIFDDICAMCKWHKGKRWAGDCDAQPCPLHFPKILNTLEQRVPNLKSVDLALCTHVLSEPVLQALNTLLQVRSLTTFTVIGEMDAFFAQIIQGSSIQTVKICRLSPGLRPINDLNLPITQPMPFLKHLSVHHNQFDNSARVDWPASAVQSLETLEATIRGPMSLRSVLNLCAPSSKTLTALDLDLREIHDYDVPLKLLGDELGKIQSLSDLKLSLVEDLEVCETPKAAYDHMESILAMLDHALLPRPTMKSLSLTFQVTLWTLPPDIIATWLKTAEFWVKIHEHLFTSIYPSLGFFTINFIHVDLFGYKHDDLFTTLTSQALEDRFGIPAQKHGRTFNFSVKKAYDVVTKY